MTLRNICIVSVFFNFSFWQYEYSIDKNKVQEKKLKYKMQKIVN